MTETTPRSPRLAHWHSFILTVPAAAIPVRAAGLANEAARLERWEWFEATIALFFREEVLIQPLELDGSADTNADTMFDHQVGEVSPVDQNDALREVLYEVAGLWAERRGGNEHALRRTETDQTANECLHVRSSDRVRRRIPLGLHIDAVEAETVFIDDTVHATVA